MRRKKQHNNISESQVEEALISNLSYLREILALEKELTLIGRQIQLKNGTKRLDILASSGKNIILIELKVTRFQEEFIDQIITYKTELIELQRNDKLIAGDIKCFLLVVEASKNEKEFSIQRGVKLIVFEPLVVLTNFYKTLSSTAKFLELKPNDFGVYNIGLIHRVLLEIPKGFLKEKEIAQNVNLSKITVHNHLRVSKEFGLVRERNHRYYLTDIGDKYVTLINSDLRREKLNEKQIEILKVFISKDPFYSSTIFGIYSIVESAFILSRNEYPIKLIELRKLFQRVAGKTHEWKSERALSTATYTFLNFAIDLDLLGKIGQQIVITPSGFKFILMLQLYKSIEMIESINK